MEILNYVLALVFSFLGVLVGLGLGYAAKEELKPGKKYFLWMQNIILVLAGIFVLYSFNLNLILFIVLGLLLTLVLAYFEPNTIIGYGLLALLVFLSIGNDNLFILMASLVFLYGFPTGSLFLIRKK